MRCRVCGEPFGPDDYMLVGLSLYGEQEVAHYPRCALPPDRLEEDDGGA